MVIREIQFSMNELPGGLLPSGTFHLSLSTTSAAVNGLDYVTLDNNLGPDNQLFTTVVLAGGAAPGVLSFSGDAFSYDPSAGNLLLDIQVSGFSHPCTSAPKTNPDCAYFDARNGTADGMFSRVHDWTPGPGYTYFGLVTTFLVPEPSTALLLVFGLAALAAGRGHRMT